MHDSVMTFVASAAKRYGLCHKSVLEVGSLDVNGSVRSLFTGSYVGTDMREGPGVDHVINAHDLIRLGSINFGVVVCTEMLEHDDAPWLSLTAMRDVVRARGYLILTCRGYDERGCFEVHGYPEDYYRYSVNGIRRLLELTGWEPLEVEPDPEAPGVLAVARAAEVSADL